MMIVTVKHEIGLQWVRVISAVTEDIKKTQLLGIGGNVPKLLIQDEF